MLAWAPFSRGPTQPHREAIDAQKFGETGVSDVTNDLVQLYVGSDALDLADLIKRKQVSAIEIVDTAISLIDHLDPELNPVVIRTFALPPQPATHPATAP